MKKAIVTCIYNEYDYIKDPQFYDISFDYFCFSDKPVKSNIWKRIPSDYNHKKKPREVKLMLPEIFKDYDLVLWVDASIKINCNVQKWIDKNHKGGMTVSKHPVRNCVYEEAEACKRLKKDSIHVIDAQVEKYRNEGLPKDIGMVQNGVFCISITDEIRRVFNAWWGEVKNHSRRDQISFNYICWKLNFEPHIVPNDEIFKINFKLHPHASTFKV